MSIELNRSAFEAFAQRNEFGTYRTDRKGDGYDSSHTQLMWMAWCAAIQQAEAQQPATGDPVGQVSDLFPSVRNKLHAKGFGSDAPLYTHPAPGEPDDVVRDAERRQKARELVEQAAARVKREQEGD